MSVPAKTVYVMTAFNEQQIIGMFSLCTVILIRGLFSLYVSYMRYEVTSTPQHHHHIYSNEYSTRELNLDSSFQPLNLNLKPNSGVLAPPNSPSLFKKPKCPPRDELV